jgi:hypothetical protein
MLVFEGFSRFGVLEGRGSEERCQIHHEDISEDHTNNW